MKKALIILLLSIFIICCTSCIYLFISNRNMSAELDKLKVEINSVKKSIDDSNSTNQALNTYYEELLKESEDEIYEYQTWKETKEKLQQALSQ